MNIYLAAILVFWVLTNSSVVAAVSPVQPVGAMQGNQPQADTSHATPPQEPAQDVQPGRPAQEAPLPSPGAAPDQTRPAKGGQEQEQSPPASEAPAPGATQGPQKATSKAPAKKPEATTQVAKKRRRRKHIAAKPDSALEKKVVKNGGTADPAAQLAPGVSNEQASRQRQSTTQLLTTTDTNLKQLASRQLSVTQQDSVSQIRKYMEQAKTAEDEGDVQRAQNLASKALMLSDDLLKH